MLSYYDAVLAIIPLLLGAGGFSGIVFQPIPLTVSIGFAALMATLVVGHALFVRTPTRGDSKTSGQSQGSEQSDQRPNSLKQQAISVMQIINF